MGKAAPEFRTIPASVLPERVLSRLVPGPKSGYIPPVVQCLVRHFGELSSRLRPTVCSAALVAGLLLAGVARGLSEGEPPTHDDPSLDAKARQGEPASFKRIRETTHVGPVPTKIRVLVGDALIAPPFVMHDQNGNWTGFNIELLRDCALAVGSRIELINIQSGQTVQQMVDSGAVDILPLAFDGDPQLTRIKVGKPLLNVAPGIWIRKEKPVSTDLATLSKIPSSALGIGPTAKWLAGQDIRPSKVARTRREALRILAEGYVDVVFGGHAVMVGEVEALNLADRLTFVSISDGESIGAVSFGYTVRSENEAFWLTAGQDVVGTSGRYAEHYRRFIATRPELDDQAVTSEAVFYSSVAGGGHLPGQTLRLGIADRGRSLDFIYNKETNAGLVIDLGLAIGRALRRPVEFVNLSDESPGDAVARGVVHAVALVPTVDTDTRNIDLLQPLLRLRGTLVMRDGEPAPTTIDELKKLRVAVTWSSGGHRYAAGIAHPNIVPVNGSQVGLDLLKNKRIDAVLMLAAAKRNLQRQGLLPGNLVEHAIPAGGYVNNEVITVRRGNSLLARDMENALAAIQSSGEFDRIYDRWLGDIEPRPNKLNWPVIYTSLGGVVVAIALGLTWIITLRRALAIRTARMRQAEEQTSVLASALPVLMYTYTVHADGTRSGLYFPIPVEGWLNRFPSMHALDRPYEHSLRAAIHPDDLEAYDQAASRARSSLTKFDFEFRLRDANGHYRWLHSISVPKRVPEGVNWDALIVDIDETRTLAQSVQSTKARFSVLVQHAPHAAIQFYDEFGHVKAWNDASTRLYGWTAEEAIGQPIGSLMLTEVEAARFRAEIARLRAGGEPGAPVELHFRTRAGGSGTLVSSVFAIPNADGSAPVEFVCMDVDITELRRVQERERIAREHLAVAMDAATIGAWHVNLLDDTVIADARIVELFGMTGRIEPGVPAANKDLLMNIAPEDIASVAKAWNDAVDEVGSYACTFRVRVDGQERWINGRGRAYPGPDGRAERMVGVSVDITELKRAQIEREQLIVALERSKRLEALGLLAAGVAHDFNNILTAISGYTAMIERNLDDPQSMRDHLHAIENSTNQAALLIRQLIARPARDRAVLSGSDIRDVVQGCVAVATARPHGRVRCRIAAQADVDQLQVNADRAQIQQVVLNLIINAAEAAEAAQSRALDLATIDVGISRRSLTDCDKLVATLSGPLPPGTYLAIDVADNGAGMDDSTQQKIFEPFFSTKVSGRGLGLSVVVSTIHALGGAIKVSSSVGLGTTFRVLLPATTLETTHPDTHEISRMIAQVEAKPTRDTHVLVVDDDPLVHDVIVRGLRSASLRVTAFRDGQQAVDWLAALDPASREQPHVALIDLSMPGIDGVETLRRLRQHRSGLNAVVMSGYASEQVSQDLADLGRVQFLQKPFKLKELQELISSTAATATTS